jgi:arylsulfatase A-like enzyme
MFPISLRAVLAASMAAALVLAAGCKENSRNVPGVDARRHVLLLTVDTLRADYVSRHDLPEATMPFVDSLLASGVKFTHAVTPIPRTSPAFASLLTGSYPHTHQVRTLFGTLSSEVTPLAELLKRKGFATVAVVSNAVLGAGRGLNRGFDVYDSVPFVGRGAVQTTNRVIHHLQSKTAEDAIFLWVVYIDPHVPYFPPTDLAKKFDPGYSGRYALHFGRRGLGESAYPADLGKAKAVFRNDLPERVNAHVRRLYAADVRHTDDQISRLLGWLRQRFGDDWTIVFAADHGESLGEHDFYYDHGDYVYDATLRVPLGVVLGENDPLRRREVVDPPVSLVDVMPTMMDLLGIPIAKPMERQIEGRSLLPFLRGETLSTKPLFAECGHSYYPDDVRGRVRFDVAGRFRAAISEDWKLIWTPGQSPDLEYQLYDLDRDPHETRNLYAEDHPRVAELKKNLEQWMRRGLPERDSAEPSESDRETLRALGYLE